MRNIIEKLECSEIRNIETVCEASKSKIQHKLTDPELYALCKKWGAEALEARRKFVGLLPEVNARRLYERRCYSSIYHFAAALSGVGRRLVDDVLRLEKLFAEMPTLHTALVNGEIGLSKLYRIVSVVNVANEAEICEKIRTLSKRAVDVLVKEMNEKRLVNNEISWEENAVGNIDGLFDLSSPDVVLEKCAQKEKMDESKGTNAVGKRDGLLKPDSDYDSPPGREIFTISGSTKNHDYEILCALSPEVKMKLKELIDKEIDVNEIFLEALAAREAEIARQKMEIVEAQIIQAKNAKCKVKNGVEVGEDVGVVGGSSGASVSVNPPAPSRHIPVKIRRVLKLEFGSRCAYQGCGQRAEQIHHEKPFAYYAEHDPRSMKPLCRGHHELVHTHFERV